MEHKRMKGNNRDETYEKKEETIKKEQMREKKTPVKLNKLE